jgi:YtkA-like
MAMRLTLLAVIAAALAVPSAATAGGWATVGFDPPPDNLAPGDTWEVDLTVLQHGRTPLEGVRPMVILSKEEGGEEASFPAHPTDEPGVYRASVVLESAGEWKLVVDDDFSARHTFPAVRVGNGGKEAASGQVAAVNTAAAAPPSSGDDGPNLLLAFGAAAVAALAAGLGAAFLQRRSGGSSPAGG